MDKKTEQEQLEIISEILRSLAHPTRIRILLSVANGQKSVSELCSELEIPQPLISVHLGELRSSYLIFGDRQGRKKIYRIADKKIIKIIELIFEYRGLKLDA